MRQKGAKAATKSKSGPSARCSARSVQRRERLLFPLEAGASMLPCQPSRGRFIRRRYHVTACVNGEEEKAPHLYYAGAGGYPCSPLPPLTSSVTLSGRPRGGATARYRLKARLTRRPERCTRPRALQAFPKVPLSCVYANCMLFPPPALGLSSSNQHPLLTASLVDLAEARLTTALQEPILWQL